MLVHGQTGPVSAAARTTGRKTVGDGAFTLTPPMQAGGPSGAPAPTRLGVLDAVLAIQERSAAEERRRRAFRRGHALLDRLEELRACLLEGELEPALLRRIRQEMAGLAEPVDHELQSLMAEIELRALVEIAKLEAAGLTA